MIAHRQLDPNRAPVRPALILYIVGGLRIGGMETHLLHLVAGLDRVRFTPVICCLYASPEYLKRIAALGVEHYDLRARTMTSPRDVARLTRLLRLIRRLRPAIVHTYGFTCDVLGPLLGPLSRGTRIITTRRGEDREAGHQRWRSRMNRRTDCIICVSEATAEFTRTTESLQRAEIRVIPNGVEIPPPRAETNEVEPRRLPLRIGTLGTVKPIKGTDLLVDAFLRLNTSVDCQLHIGGRTDVGAWGEELVRRAQASDAGERIHFDGYQSDPWRFLASIDVFALPSRSEGMSNSLLEAMACGLPCVVTDVGSNAAVVAPANTPRPGGLVTTPDVEGIHRALARAVENPQARRAWGQGAYELACRNHSMQVMVTAHEKVYADLLGG